jgi:2-isopropylmalate synthase
MSNQLITILDTTLRDGSQMEGINFTVKDKLKIAQLLDELGIHYIEGGWPGSNPKDIEFFKQAKALKLKYAKLTAFASTRRAKFAAEKDPNLQALLESETPAVSIFGKTWDFHVKDALKVSLEENLALIEDSVRYLKQHGREVLFDAEHFFDGYKANPKYALECLKAAERAGADYLVLCDTNGGSLAFEAQEIIGKILPHLKTPLGIHAHNDSNCAVSVSGMAVKCGATHVQGTINGYGERCGNADLCSVIPILMLKLGHKVISPEKLKTLTELSRHISEIANMVPPPNQPFVGRCAFTHKGGIHVSAVLKNPQTYEHIDPAKVGNERHVTVSELSGVSNLVFKAKEYGIDLTSDSPHLKKLLSQLKQLEHEGFAFEEGEASFELVVKKAVGQAKPAFKLKEFKVSSIKEGRQDTTVHAKLVLEIKGQERETRAAGDGPINALDAALRKALLAYYPEIESVRLTDYKVRVLDSKEGTAAKVRVMIESADEDGVWVTVGVSTNVIEASWQALVDSLEYKLMRSQMTSAKE